MTNPDGLSYQRGVLYSINKVKLKRLPGLRFNNIVDNTNDDNEIKITFLLRVYYMSGL